MRRWPLTHESGALESRLKAGRSALTRETEVRPLALQSGTLWIIPYKNPVDQKAAQQRHYQANRANEIRKAGLRKQAGRVKLRKIIAEAKSVPCVDCKQRFPSCVMDFHHLEGKDGEIAGMVGRNVSVKRLLAEIAKCIVLCANCHRIRTFGGCVSVTQPRL